MQELLRDFRYAGRVLLKTPAATTVAVLALALGIGVNASAFVSIDSIVLHPFAYPRLDRIMTVWENTSKSQERNTALAPADYIDLARSSRSFESFAAYRGWNASLTGAGNPQTVQAYQVSPSFFTTLGMKAALGRTLAADEDQPGHSNVVVVSEAFWKSQLAGSQAAAGKPLKLNGRTYIVVGVMPDKFDFPLAADIWTPLVLEPADEKERGSRTLMTLGLLKSGVGVEQARAEMATIAARLRQQYPTTNEGRDIVIVPLRDIAENVTNHFVVTLLGAAIFVLLLACANIGNLQLARAAGREQEFAVRTALGGSRARIARQMLVESVLISVVAGFVGLALASWDTDYMRAYIPPVALRFVPGLRTLAVTPTVVAYTFIVSIVAGLLCSLPAMAQAAPRKSRANLNDALRGRSGTATSPARNRMRTALVVSELALALTLLVGAGLMVKTFNRLLEINQGFDPKNLLTMQVSLPALDYKDGSTMTALYDRVLQGFGALPGVQASGLTSEYYARAEGLRIEGQPEPRPGEPRPLIAAISHNYLAAMRIPVIQGRSISDRDRPGAPRVAVISNSVARHYWPNSDAVGRRIKLDAQSDWLTVVGVAGDVIDDWFSGRATPAMYVSYAQFPNAHAEFVLRTPGDPTAVAKAARLRIQTVDPALGVYELKTMEQSNYEQRGGVHAAATAMTTYAVVALLLAVTGIYAVISYFVAARTHDIGVHVALGATRADVLRLTLRQTMRLMMTGLAVGVPLAIALSRLMSSALFNVVRLEASTFLAFTAILVAAGLLASYVPSRRAARIDPMVALRNE